MGGALTMSSSAKQSFNKSVRLDKRPAPFSIRLSADERAALERKAGQRPLGSYIRTKLLGDDVTPRKASRAPTIDYALLGQVLGMLGQSDQVRCLFMLLVAAEAGSIELADDENAALMQACDEVHEMRSVLVKALGLRGSSKS
tara:strand:+ start:1147 stop:1575 length:429 start_codon:yes stop_codon:yes gene_type:complete